MEVREIDGKNLAEIKSLYWVWYLIVTAVPVIILLGIVVEWVLGIIHAGEGISGLIYVTVLLHGSVVWLPAMVGSLLGYYKESKALTDVESNWQPSWKMFAGIHIIFTPFVAAPIFLILRTLALGRPSKTQYVRTRPEE